ncbi:MAG: DUF805 domain-containing protein [Pseudomonadota bacterium]
MGAIEAIGVRLRQYAWFGGRAPRPEFWWFVPFYGLVGLVPLAGAVIQLAPPPPSLAVTWRRRHGVGMSGWWSMFPTAAIVPTLAIASLELENPGVSENAPTLIYLGFRLTLGSIALAMVRLIRPSQSSDDACGPDPPSRIDPRAYRAFE